MKSHPNSIPLILLASLILFTSVSCSGPDFGGQARENAAAIEQLESRFDELEGGLGSVVFWQALAAVFFVLVGLALVGGAALGSRARRDREGLPEASTPGRRNPSNPDTSRP